MKIAVCVKQVPDATVSKKIDPGTKRLDRSGEAALTRPTSTRSKRRSGSRRARAARWCSCRSALRRRSSRCARRSRWARTAPCSSPTRPPPAPTSWARATRSRRRSSVSRPTSSSSARPRTTGTAPSSGPRSRSASSVPVVSQVASLTVEEGSVSGKRQTEHGYDQIRAPLPAVVAVSDAINEPRYPSLKGIMGAKTKPQETLAFADLGVEGDRAGEAGAKTTVLELAPPPSRGDSVKIEDDGSRRREDPRVPRRAEAPVKSPRLPRALPRRAREGRPRGAREGGLARRRGRCRARPGRTRGCRCGGCIRRLRGLRVRGRGALVAAPAGAGRRARRRSSRRPARTTSSSRPPSSRATSPPRSLRGSRPVSTGI